MQPLVANSGVMKLWASKFWPVRGRNHWPGLRVLVSVEIVPGGPHSMILPFTASAISWTDQRGGFDFGKEGLEHWGVIFLDFGGEYEIKKILGEFIKIIFVADKGEKLMNLDQICEDKQP